VSLSYAHDHGRDATTTFTAAGSSTSVTLTTTHPGSFTTLSTGLNGQLKSSGLGFYVRGDLRAGAGINGYAVTAGMRTKF